jgi:hypothetical protein
MQRIAALVTLLGAMAASAGLPPEDECPTLTNIPGASPAEDATSYRLREGQLLHFADMLLLGSLLPTEVWRNRDAFFHEGMRMELGPCHRRYAQAEWFDEATKRFAGQARIDADGNLSGHVAGLPFPPDSIDPESPDAGVKWAWNLERRYRGAGHVGSFRIVDMPSRMGGVQTYMGTWFLLQTSHRADLAASDYTLPEVADDSEWVAGGIFNEPTPARHLAWRQIRPLEVALHFEQPDDTFVYVPTMRKVRRAASGWVDGLYMPRYRVSGDAGGGPIPLGGSNMMPGGSANPTAGESIQVTENLRRGFTGLALRPNAYEWRYQGEREVIAPINVTRGGYPQEKERNFGPSGLSIGNDRWDVRHAVILQGSLKERGQEYDLVTLWIDYQTAQPLYIVTRRRMAQQMVEVGILVSRYSGDLSAYPSWPGGAKARVFDPVAAMFYDATEGGSGWRRESFDLESVPPDESEIRRFTSPGFLDRGH